MKIQTKSSADSVTTSLSLANQRKNKQTKSQHKSHFIILQKITGPNLGGKTLKGRNNLTFKPGKRRPQSQ